MPDAILIVKRWKSGWTITINGESMYLTHNQYGRYLAWQGTDFSPQQMFPELSDAEHKFLMSGRGPPPTASRMNT